MEQKLIEVKTLKQKIMKTYLPSDSLTAGLLYDLISLAAPAADIIPVVRCGECKFMKVGICLSKDSYLYGKSPKSDWYCPCSEPRTPPAE